jgi:hypothetical protein
LEVREDIHTRKVHASHSFESGMAILVVAVPLIGVGQDSKRLRGFFELLLGAFITGVAIRMILQRGLFVGFANIIWPSLAANAEHLVIISLLGHGGVSGARPVS